VELLNRALILTALAACGFGFPRPKGLAWIEREGLAEALSPSEERFLRREKGRREGYQKQVEALWALCWVLGVTDSLDFDVACPSDFVTMLPNLKTGEPSDWFRSRCHLRSPEEVGAACDTAYCLHWALREARLAGGPWPPQVIPWILLERRRALEWSLSEDEWDQVPLDT
jgi:hypothetical protein